jgi:hypothetical protein
MIMSSSHNLSELLKFAKDVPVLNTGISDNAIEYSTYPVKEHNRLLSSSGKPMSTPLNSLLTFRNIKIPTDRNNPNFKDKAQLESYKKNALTLTFRGTRTASTSKVEWVEYLLHLVPLVIEHPKILLSESKNLSQTMSKLYRASSDFIGDASPSVEQRSTLKVKSLCLPILADDPWEPGAQEDDKIDVIVLEELGIVSSPAVGMTRKSLIIWLSNTRSPYHSCVNYSTIPSCALFTTLARDKRKVNIKRYKGLLLHKMP